MISLKSPPQWLLLLRASVALLLLIFLLHPGRFCELHYEVISLAVSPSRCYS